MMTGTTVIVAIMETPTIQLVMGVEAIPTMDTDISSNGPMLPVHRPMAMHKLRGCPTNPQPARRVDQQA